MASEATYDLKFELLDRVQLCSLVSLASKCSTLTNVTDAHFYANPLLGYRGEIPAIDELAREALPARKNENVSHISPA